MIYYIKFNVDWINFPNDKIGHTGWDPSLNTDNRINKYRRGILLKIIIKGVKEINQFYTGAKLRNPTAAMQIWWRRFRGALLKIYYCLVETREIPKGKLCPPL